MLIENVQRPTCRSTYQTGKCLNIVDLYWYLSDIWARTSVAVYKDKTEVIVFGDKDRLKVIYSVILKTKIVVVDPDLNFNQEKDG